MSEQHMQPRAVIRGTGIKEKITPTAEPEAGYAAAKNLGFRIKRPRLKPQFQHLTICETVGTLSHIQGLPLPVSVAMDITTLQGRHLVARSSGNTVGKDLHVVLGYTLDGSCEDGDKENAPSALS